MCGLVGMVTRDGDRPAVRPADLVRMRDRLAHRGPDDTGMLLERNIGLAHTRLAVIDPSPSGRQPMRTPDARFTIVYNGEIYNDAELRASLGIEGPWQTACDTETVLRLLAREGERGLARLRGMFALALHDRHEQTLLLARDPLGIKPLYFWRGTLDGRIHVIFASEPAAILAHPGVSARPDLAAINGYLTTIRTVQGDRTMFEGVRAIRPGEWIVFDLRSCDLRERRGTIEPEADTDRGDASVRAVVVDSVRRHLRSDVPSCALLSGGLDSTIIAAVAAESVPDLRTFCAGSPSETEDDDLTAARSVAGALGLAHTTVPIDQALFLDRWVEMVSRLGVPLSTPNEVAINEVARRLRADGFSVTLSGEGADEFFAGYDAPLSGVRRFLTANPRATVRDRAACELESNGWVAPSIKSGLLREPADDSLLAWQETELAHCDAKIEADGLETDELDRRLAGHLLLQQRVNLVGLLGRLDSAAMLESVEGRTPLADTAVARAARGLTLREKIIWDEGGVRTKIALRDAFAGRIPASAVRRPKASFPLPFIGWMDPLAGILRESTLLEAIFLPGVIETVSRTPAELWRLAWPMLNLSLWERAVWGHEKRPGVRPGVRVFEPSASMD